MKALKWLGFVLVAFFILAFTKDFLVKASVERGVQFVTGLKLRMGSFKVGILSTNIKIKDLRLQNPKDFQEKTMLDMPEISVDYHLQDILKGKIHLESIVIDLAEFNIVKNKEGKLNLDSLKVVQEGKEKGEPAKKEPSKEKKKAPQFQIDHLQLKVGKVSFKDYSKGEKPSVNDFEFNLDEKHENITNPQILVAIILQKAFLNASIAKLSGFDLSGIQGSLTNAVGNLQGLANQALGSASQLAGGVLNQAKSLPGTVNLDGMKNLGGTAASSATEGAKQAVDSLKGLTGKLKLPTLGGEEK